MVHERVQGFTLVLEINGECVFGRFFIVDFLIGAYILMVWKTAEKKKVEPQVLSTKSAYGRQTSTAPESTPDHFVHSVHYNRKLVLYFNYLIKMS